MSKRAGKQVGWLLQEATKFLRNKGIPGSRAEAELLLAHVWAKDRIFLWSYSQKEVPEQVERNFWQVVEQRSKKLPLAYITGQKEFYRLNFQVNPHVLIPRPETELLVDLAVKSPFLDGDIAIVDLGTGSGVLAITLARLYPQAKVWAVDISSDALFLAQENARLHGVEERINFLPGDYWKAFEDQDLKFNLVVSNPPYVTSSEMKKLPPDVKDWEPNQALYGGEKGLEAYRAILNRLPSYLRSPSLTLLEISPTVSESICKLCQQYGLDRPPFNFKIISDYAGKNRVLYLSERN